MPMVYSRNGATLLGGAAILLWSTSVALMRDISETLGAAGGAAMLYSVSTVFLLLLLGWPKLRGCSRGYLCWGGLLFVVYEICLALSLGYASDRSQAIELGMINYLWPCLTVMLAIVMNGQRAGPAVYAGLFLSLFGIGWLMCGDGTWTPRHMLHNIRQNPLSYTLAFSGAIVWALYCNVTRKYAGGKNGVAMFFLATSLLLWLKYGLSQDATMLFTSRIILQLLVTGAIMGTAYAAWNIGIIQGNMTLLATASYFTPVLSAAFASLWLGVALTPAFWQGVVMVCAGSLICWWFTRRA
ncbi:Putative inner membrane protein [Sodalis praecaptivus]|uniref:Putative inner membrane protein n=1 Tax=Sodalis praecaptivus TaxID=1239307 RepID=W0HWW2_9GAMM|nr:aromatic amino acid DMT transporter YddG [Sodalis praecaptivus]AHF76695.1 Putative inner membrane protein [Sodalis praecaptivus]